MVEHQLCSADGGAKCDVALGREEERALAFEVGGGYVAGDEGGDVARGAAVIKGQSMLEPVREDVGGCSPLPVEKRLVAQHPEPLPIEEVVDGQIRVDGTGLVIRVEAGDGVAVVPV